MKTILLIDDDPATLEVINGCLLPHYGTRIATRAARGLELARTAPRPDLILLDLELPDLDGYAVCRILKGDPVTAQIPVIFLSSHAESADIIYGLELGAVDYVSKPVIAPILLARIRTQLRLHQAQLQLADRNGHLESLVSERTRDLQMIEELTIGALGAVAETRDNETGNHILRTRAYVEKLCRELKTVPSRQAGVADEDWRQFWKCAPLHDIGKVGIPDHILLKPGKLSVAEFDVMKTHTTLGRNALRSPQMRTQYAGAFLRVASEIAYSHHERWDGSGYPEGLSGSAIPLSARLMAVADVYDALISKRVYKAPVAPADAVAIIVEGRGRHFDPVIVDCFLDCTSAFDEIAAGFSDLGAGEELPTGLQQPT
ncbi:MAG: HD domain-containing phosphohydrolase [Pseudomonadota bacterium]